MKSSKHAALLSALVAVTAISGFTFCQKKAEQGAAVNTASSSIDSPTRKNPRQAPTGDVPAGMVWIPGGEFSMGETAVSTGLCGDGEASRDTVPIHRVAVDGFWMDSTEVTTAEFAKFIAATNYRTVAERPLNPTEFPDVPPEDLKPGANVFTPTLAPVPLDNSIRWWRFQYGADWRHPEGPGTDLAGKDNYPVAQIAYEDAQAYAKWAEKRLPTEAEWEFAARGGMSGKAFAWGDEPPTAANFRANLYQGTFPGADSGEDGYAGAGPVAKFPANGFGLYDVAGNVWEWTTDWYRPDTYAHDATMGVVHNPHGPDSSVDPSEPGVAKKVIRGGSFLCTIQFCTRYRIGSRGQAEPNSPTMHLGFRCVK